MVGKMGGFGLVWFGLVGVGWVFKGRLITQLGKTKPKLVSDIEKSIKDYCQSFKYKVIDASAERTGRDFLLKI